MLGQVQSVAIHRPLVVCSLLIDSGKSIYWNRFKFDHQVVVGVVLVGYEFIFH